MQRWFFLLLLLFFQTACDSTVVKDRPTSSLLHSSGQIQNLAPEAEPSFEPLVATDLLNKPTPVYRFETTAEALSVWRRATVRPTLLLLSNNPHLTPVPEELRERTANLINNANVENLAEAASDRTPAPLILPGMAIDAALRNGWFKELAWAFPLRDPEQDLDLASFTEQFATIDLADADEVASMTLSGQTFHGVLRGTPFTAAALSQLHDLAQPVIVHIDLSYFQPLYKNEISTPMLDIVTNTLAILKQMHLQTLAVTFSYGHRDSQIALDVRFLGDVLAWLIEDPAHHDQPVPLNWQRQRDALYLANFLQKDKIQELYQAQAQDDPNSAWVKFNLYQSAINLKQPDVGLRHLAEAVVLDPIFAFEYFNLADLAYQQNRPAEALRLLSLASQALPNDPFIKLQMAQLAYETGDRTTALQLLNQLRKLSWSPYYYAQVPQYLQELTTFVTSGEMPAEAPAPEPSQQISAQNAPGLPTATTRQKILHSSGRQ